MLSSLRWVSDSSSPNYFELNVRLIVCRVSMSMDRPNMLNCTPFMKRSLSYLRNSPHAATTDKKLAAWVDLQHLSEEVADAFRRGRTNVVSLEDPQVRGQVEQLSRKFETWWENVDKNILDGKHRDQFWRIALILRQTPYSLHITTTKQESMRLCYTLTIN